jgi:hypothetical protein
MVSFALPAWRRAKQESDRDAEYGAQAYQQEMAVTSIEQQARLSGDTLAKQETESEEANAGNEVV